MTNRNTLKYFSRVINANLKHEIEVFTSGRVTDEMKLKIREERISVMEWVKEWVDRIRKEEKKLAKATASHNEPIGE